MSVTPLKRMIMENSLEIKDLAQECNISSSYLSLIVNGHRTNIDERIIDALALKLNVSQDDIKSLLIPLKKERKENLTIEKKVSYWLNNLLNALEVNNKEGLDFYTNQIFGVSDVFP